MERLKIYKFLKMLIFMIASRECISGFFRWLGVGLGVAAICYGAGQCNKLSAEGEADKIRANAEAVRIEAEATKTWAEAAKMRAEAEAMQNGRRSEIYQMPAASGSLEYKFQSSKD